MEKEGKRKKNNGSSVLSYFHVTSLVPGVFLPHVASASKPLPQKAKFLQSQILGSCIFQLSFTLCKAPIVEKDMGLPADTNELKVLLQEARSPADHKSSVYPSVPS